MQEQEKKIENYIIERNGRKFIFKMENADIDAIMKVVAKMIRK